MNKDQVWTELDKIYWEERIPFTDFFNYFDIADCEQFLEFVKKERGDEK